MAYGRDELVLHALKPAAIGDVLKGHNHAGDLAIVDERRGCVLHRNRSSIVTPEDFVPHANRFAAAQALKNRTVGLGIRCAIDVAMVNDLVYIAARQLFGGISESARSGLVDKGEPAIQVDAINALSRRFKNQL